MLQAKREKTNAFEEEVKLEKKKEKRKEKEWKELLIAARNQSPDPLLLEEGSPIALSVRHPKCEFII